MKFVSVLLSFLVLFLGNTHVYAHGTHDEISYDRLGNLPVLHEGRIKPLESFARIHLQKWAMQDSLDGHSALDIIANALFDPQSVANKKLFYLRNDRVKDQLGMEEDDQDYFSLQELLPFLDKSKDQLSALLNKDPNDLTSDQKDFLAVHENIAAFSALMRSFSLILPLDIVLPEKYAERFDSKELNYLTLSAIETPLVEDLQDIIRQKGEDLGRYNEEEKKVALLAFQLQNLRVSGETSRLFKIIPSSWDVKSDEWYAPWELITKGQGSPIAVEYLNLWRNAASAYRDQNHDQWEESIQKIENYIQAKSLYSPSVFVLERVYNAIEPYFWAKMFYALSALLLIVFLVRKNPAFVDIAIISASLGALLHLGAIIARVLILDRPPVGTLYESVLFVSLICVATVLFLAMKSRNIEIMLAGFLSGFFLLFIAPVIAPEGESLEVLVAVLNTNFWLATHVIVITIGYGICLICACMAHFYLFTRITKHKKEESVLTLYAATHKLSVLALLFTAIGTILGGIWADQSWGRFWGWDPKENGALLIVLWLIWLQHGRLSAHLKDVPFMAGMAFLNVIVAIAWFGVNLLGVGLHSYGFTTGLAYGLALFCGLEILIIAALWIGVRMSEKRLKHAQ